MFQETHSEAKKKQVKLIITMLQTQAPGLFN